MKSHQNKSSMWAWSSVMTFAPILSYDLCPMNRQMAKGRKEASLLRAKREKIECCTIMMIIYLCYFMHSSASHISLPKDTNQSIYCFSRLLSMMIDSNEAHSHIFFLS